MPTTRRRVKQELAGAIDNLEWATTHVNRVSQAFDAYTEELLKLNQGEGVIPDEDTLQRYLGYSTILKELETALVSLVDIITRLSGEI